MFRPPQAPEVQMGFQEMNQGKRSVRLNLARPEAREIARQLARLSDVVFQNFRPGVLERMGLGYSDLKALRPDLLFCSVSALGQEGPEASYSGYAPTFAASGLNYLTGYPDREPAIPRAPADPIVATTAAFALLAALEARARDGRGRSVDLSSVEALAVMTAEALVDFAATGVAPSRAANEDPEFFPHDCYACSGEDAWISIAISDAAEWQALARIIGREDLGDQRPGFGFRPRPRRGNQRGHFRLDFRARQVGGDLRLLSRPPACLPSRRSARSSASRIPI